MDKVINLGIPHVGELIFESIDTPGLIKCLEVSETWRELAGNVLIQRWKGKMNSEMRKACIFGQTKIIQLLLERCIPEELGLNIKDQLGLTPLMWACQNGFKDVVKLLLDHSEEHRIDLNVEGMSENTAIMWACEFGHKEIVKLLLNHSNSNIDLSARVGFFRRTVLMFACKDGHKDIVEILLERLDRFDLNAKDRNGWTALKYAEKGADSEFRLIWGHRSDYQEIVEMIKAKLNPKEFFV